MAKRRHVVVIGGGVVGLCCAHSMRANDIDVSIVERDRCGSGASLGNAGWITPALSVPLPSPGVMRQTTKWMTRADSPFRIYPRFDLDFLRWCWKFWRNSTPDTYRKGLRALMALNRHTFSLFDQLKAVGVDFEMHNAGMILAALSEEAARQQFETLREMRDFGYQGGVELLDTTGLRALEPALSDSVVAGVLINEERHVRPETLCRGLVAHLRSHGVDVIENAEATMLERDGRHGVWKVAAGDSRLVADDVVIAAGIWTRHVLAGLRVRLPLEAAKGYSVTAIGTGSQPRHTLYLSEARVGCSPYRDCLRLAGTLELAGLDPTVSRRRLDAVVRSARTYLKNWEPKRPLLEWAGFRPVTPDGLPVIGPVPGMRGLFVATGHAMLGVTLAPATGAALSALIQGGSTPSELLPFQPARFLRMKTTRRERGA